MTDWRAEHDAELMLRREWSARAQKAEAEIERYETALREIIDLDHHSHGPESRATKIARAATQPQ